MEKEANQITIALSASFGIVDQNAPRLRMARILTGIVGKRGGPIGINTAELGFDFD
jgi:hypothetical protein